MLQVKVSKGVCDTMPVMCKFLNFILELVFVCVCVLCALLNPNAAQRSQSESPSGSQLGETTSLKSTVFPQSL